jgi:transglutaminase-like putative cysteine protease
MKLTISYRAEYAYDKPVSLSPHVVRLFPRDAWPVRVTALDFSTNVSADVHWRRDIFDNLVARCFYPDHEPRLIFSFDASVETVARNPFGFLLETRALKLPVAYDGRECALLDVCLGPDDLALPEGLRPAGDVDTVEALVGMNEWIYRNIAYERREEGEAFAPEETLNRGCGACRDTAVLLAAALRARGLAARLASGYLWESASDPAERKADSALHAWTEVYLPGAGWVAMDPSNGVFADHHYIATAVGTLPEDIAPVSGLYFGDQPVPGRLATSLRIERADA